ncbi:MULTISPECIES: endonuclease/exonuclease/phosphatase family protein [unclassified Pseudomonas]|uniref:endonuclease/exonuclease/phosphatase family protein n=1 Tax=unclassified Pseudomonas TaxID=196821 RepID=UPI00111C2250|nr:MULTISPECIES: endonuclease/exonuclease/phosphatase family protein [unclassified Pseudomonas]
MEENLVMSEAAREVVFAWWNTSLAPSGVSRSTAEQRAVACSVVMYLIKSCGADFIALGEMSEVDLKFLEQACDLQDYTFSSEITNAGRSVFDICYIYNRRKIFVSDSKDVLSVKGASILKVAKKLELIVSGSESLFYIFVSHWPSRLWCAQNDADRHVFGIRLRDSIDQVSSETDRNQFIVLLGDYNDDPFDASLSQQVMASRDIDLVERRPHLFYNPFWKYLSKQSSDHKVSGSYFYKSGKITRWHTFDQIIFSHAFVSSNEWALSKKCDHVVEVPGFTDLVKSKDSQFDHLPVFGIIEKVAHNG